MDYDVFLSFSEKDRALVDEIYNHLNKNYCIFEYSKIIHGGTDIFEKISSAIENSKIFVPIFTSESVQSQVFIIECYIALMLFKQAKINLLPILVDKDKMFWWIPNTVEYIDYSKDPNNFIENINTSLFNLLSNNRTNLTLLFNKLDQDYKFQSLDENIELKILKSFDARMNITERVLLIYIHKTTNRKPYTKDELRMIDQYYQDKLEDINIIACEHEIEGISDDIFTIRPYNKDYLGQSVGLCLYNKNNIEKITLLENALDNISSSIMNTILTEDTFQI